VNVEVYLANPVGVGEHSDIMEAIEKELEEMAKYHDHIEVLKEYF
jgi:predicted DNA-binding protein